MFNLPRFIVAVVTAVVVGIVLVALIGPLLVTMNTPITDIVGGFCKNWGWVLGIIAGLLYYFGARGSAV